LLPQPGNSGGATGGHVEPKARVLSFWFSDPAFDSQTWHDVMLFDGSGQPVPQPFGFASRFREAGEQTGNTAWLLDTLNYDAATNLPPRLTVRLRYTSGPINYKWTIPSSSSGTMFLDGGSLINGVGQKADGTAFISIAEDAANMQTQRFSVKATTTDGQELQQSAGYSGSTPGSAVLAATFEFDTSLSNIDYFSIGTRPVRAMEWRDVVLPQK
jgi:hypothetical protein